MNPEQQDPKALSPEEIEAAKKTINKEGWEGSAAVHIGTREELDRQREILETEGRTVDLGTYLKMHKEVAVSNDDPEMTDEIKKLFGEKIGGYLIDYRSSHATRILYIDKDGQLARVYIDTDKVAAYDGKSSSYPSRGYQTQHGTVAAAMEDDLKKLGFKDELLEAFKRGEITQQEMTSLKKIELEETIAGLLYAKQSRLQEEAAKAKQANFEF